MKGLSETVTTSGTRNYMTKTGTLLILNYQLTTYLHHKTNIVLTMFVNSFSLEISNRIIPSPYGFTLYFSRHIADIVILHYILYSYPNNVQN